jgi:RNA polymerase sigma-70 factor (ECF subfamily)
MDQLPRVLRQAYAPVLGRLIRFTRDLSAAEDAVQQAMVRALSKWPRQGIPDVPEAWLVHVAVNVHRDGRRARRRRDRAESAIEALATRCPWSETLLATEAAGWPDDSIRLLFTCCDPVLGPEERAAIALATVAGLSTREIARAFLVQPDAMERRLGRARARLRERRAGYEVPGPAVAPERLEAALATIHLIFNEGHWASGDESPIRRDLTALALRMARAVHALLPRAPDVQGFLALLLLHVARMPARLDDAGDPVPLDRQDRSKWDSVTIDEACALLRDDLEQGPPGPYSIEAAIAAVHCSARRAEDTDWAQIDLLYAALERQRLDPVVRVNRAYAAGRAHGAAVGLGLLEGVADHPALVRYVHAHLVRGVLLVEAGDAAGGVAALQRAHALSQSRFERAQIEQRIEAVRALVRR